MTNRRTFITSIAGITATAAAAAATVTQPNPVVRIRFTADEPEDDPLTIVSDGVTVAEAYDNMLKDLVFATFPLEDYPEANAVFREQRPLFINGRRLHHHWHFAGDEGFTIEVLKVVDTVARKQNCFSII